MTPFDCPRCGTTLTMSERHGIEIDYCQQCRGVWLDRGELDKIIERVASGAPAPAAQPQPQPQTGGWTQPPQPNWTPPPQHQAPYQPPPYQQGGYPRHYDRDDDHRRDGHYGKPRKHWLSDLFD